MCRAQQESDPKFKVTKETENEGRVAELCPVFSHSLDICRPKGRKCF
jgi:hypothetical protein